MPRAPDLAHAVQAFRRDWRTRPTMWLALLGFVLILISRPVTLGAVMLAAAIGIGMRIVFGPAPDSASNLQVFVRRGATGDREAVVMPINTFKCRKLKRPKRYVLGSWRQVRTAEYKALGKTTAEIDGEIARLEALGVADSDYIWVAPNRSSSSSSWLSVLSALAGGGKTVHVRSHRRRPPRR